MTDNKITAPEEIEIFIEYSKKFVKSNNEKELFENKIIIDDIILKYSNGKILNVFNYTTISDFSDYFHTYLYNKIINIHDR
jgi:hypothetical protein